MSLAIVGFRGTLVLGLERPNDGKTMERETSILKIALVGALVGAALALPQFMRAPSWVSVGGLMAAAMVGAILIAIAARLLIRPKR